MVDMFEYTNDIKYKTISYLVNKLMSGQIYYSHGYEKDEDIDIQIYLFYIMAISILLNNYSFFDTKVDQLRWSNLRVFNSLKLNDIEIGKYKVESPDEINIIKNVIDNRKHKIRVSKKLVRRFRIELKPEYANSKLLNEIIKNIDSIYKDFLERKELYDKVAKYTVLPDSIITAIFEDDNMGIIKYFRNSSAHITSYIKNDHFICIPKDIDEDESLIIEFSMDQIAEIINKYLINIRPLINNSPEALEKYKLFIRMVDIMRSILAKCIENGKTNEQFERAGDILSYILRHNKNYRRNIDLEDLTTKAYMESLLNILYVQTDYKEFEDEDFDLNNVKVDYSRPKEYERRKNLVDKSFLDFSDVNVAFDNMEQAYKENRISNEKYNTIIKQNMARREKTAQILKLHMRELRELFKINGHKVIEGVRNSLAHGSHNYEKRDGEYYVMINDYYAKKDSTFKCEVPFYDLIGALLNNNVVSRKYGKVQNPNNNEVSTISK